MIFFKDLLCEITLFTGCIKVISIAKLNCLKDYKKLLYYIINSMTIISGGSQ